MRPAIVVLSAVDPARFRAAGPHIRTLAGGIRVALAGAGAGPATTRGLGAETLAGDLIEEADALRP
jgi:hypothetical protein